MIRLIKKISKLTEKNWRLKVFAFWVLSILPSKILFFLQHNITNRSTRKILKIDTDWAFMLEKISELNCDEEIKLLEFGAGRNLAQNIYLALSYENLSQTVVDLNPMLNAKLTFQAYYEICKLLNKDVKNKFKNLNELLHFLKIDYLAPLDISTFSTEEKYHVCISKDTLEHIPKKNLYKIFQNLNKLISHNGVLISCVDYSDHYSHTNKYLSKVNFLKYSAFAWFFLNPPNHFQNRIRHNELKGILEDCNFINHEERLEKIDAANVNIAENFKKFKLEELLIVRSQILSKNKV